MAAPTHPNVATEIALRTDPGRDPDKQVNEDAAIYTDTALGLLAVVCDGMGGHAGGKEASELAIATITEVVSAAPTMASPGAALKHAIEEANARIWAMPTAEVGYRPGSTVVAMLLHPGGAEVAHVGDSRIYLAHAGAISQVTRDHSMVQEMVDRNLIRAEDAARHPDANKILRALGIAKEVEVDLREAPIPFVNGDTFVLCSDGLSDLVEPAEILELAGANPPAQAAGQLVDLANARGGHDNITALVLRMKANAQTRDTGPIRKTIPLTAAPADVGSGPTGTVVSAPFVPAGLARTQIDVGPVGPGPSNPVPAASRLDGRVSLPPRPRTAVVAIGIVLAVLAVAIVGAGVFLFTRPSHHRSVPVVDDRRDASAANVEEDAGEAPVIPAPPLVDPAKPRWQPKDGQAPDPCGALRRARERDASADLINRLTEKCAAASGQP